MGVNIENMAIIEQIFVDFAKKIEGSVWPANFLGVMQKSQIIYPNCQIQYILKIYVDNSYHFDYHLLVFYFVEN